MKFGYLSGVRKCHCERRSLEAISYLCIRLCFLGIISPATILFSEVPEQVNVTDLGVFAYDDNYRMEERRINIKTGKSEFGLSNVNFWWKKGTYQGRICGGVGLYAPTVNLWYYQDAFSPIVNGKKVWLDHIPSFSVVERGNRGIVDTIWRDEKYAVRLRILALSNSDHLLLDYVVEEKEPIESFGIELGCYPYTFTKEGIRSVATSVREIQVEKQVMLDPLKEWWIQFYDAKFGGSSAGIIFDPKDVAEVIATSPENYSIITTIKLKPNVKHFRIAIWNFTEKPEAGREVLRSRAESVLQELRNTDFFPSDISVFNCQKKIDEFKQKFPKAEPGTLSDFNSSANEIEDIKVLLKNPEVSQPIGLEDEFRKLSRDLVSFVTKEIRRERTGKELNIIHVKGPYCRIFGFEQAIARLDKKVNLYRSSYLSVGMWESSGGSVTWFPGTEQEYAEMQRYDVVILDNVPACALRSNSQELLCRFVKEGGGLIITGGFYAFGKGAYLGTPLESFLPVIVGNLFDLVKSPAKLTPAKQGFFDSKIDWKKCPVSIYQHIDPVVSDTEVLINAGTQPWMITKQVGEGRVIAILGTVLGKPSAGERAFWEWTDWQNVLSRVLQYAKEGK